MTLVLDSIADRILSIVDTPRSDGFVPPEQRPDVRFGRFMPDGTPRISPSQVNTLRMCPARWKHQYLEGRPDGGSYQAVVGSLGHAAMEAALETIDDPVGPRALAASVERAACMHLLRPATLQGTKNGGQADVPRLAAALAQSVRATWEWLLFHEVEVLGVEERTVGTYRHRTRVDSLSFVDARLRLDGEERIIDWKFPGRSPWQQRGQAEARPAYQLVMQMYGDAYRTAGRSIDEALIVHAGLDGQGVLVSRQSIDAESLAASRRLVHEAIDVVLDARFDPDPVTPGPLCSTTWCPHFSICPAT